MRSGTVTICGGRLLGLYARCSLVPPFPFQVRLSASGIHQLHVVDRAPLACPVTASYHNTNGAALADADFSERSGTVLFAAGSANGATQTVTVPLLSDALNEDNETFFVDLTAATGADIGTAARTTVTSTGEDPMRSVTDGSVSKQEGDAGTSSAVFTVTLSTRSGRNISVNYATIDGTAVAGQDYTATSCTLTIPAGSSSATIAVAISGDYLLRDPFTMARSTDLLILHIPIWCTKSLIVEARRCCHQARCTRTQAHTRT